MNIRKFVAEFELVFALVSLILARCIDRVLYTRITYDYVQFLWYFSNIILPVAFCVTAWPVVWFKMSCTSDITKQMRSFPHYKFAIMALFDTLFNLLSAFPTPHLGGNLTNVLNQVMLPMNMLLSLLILKTQYKRCHILGSILVLYGGLVDMIPIFKGDMTENMPSPTIGWISLYIFSLLPSAASNVYKEIGLKDVDLDIWYCNAWVSTYQILWGLLTFWTIQIKAFADPPVPISNLFGYFKQAHECFLGNPIDFHGSVLTCDEGVFNVFMIFIVFNMVYNQLMLYIFKEGSSVLFVVSSAVCLPLTDLLYMVPFIAGPKASQRFTIYDGFSLFVLVMGLLVYHSEKEQRKEGAKSIEKSPMFPSPSLQRTHLMKKKSGKIIYRQSPNFPKSPKSKIQRPLRGNNVFSGRGQYGSTGTNKEDNTSLV